ncbi:MAG: hypothetical protein ACR2PH_15400 [Desulfobulbia bacterium]
MVEKFQKFKIETTYNKLLLCLFQQRLELRSSDKALQSVIDLNRPHQLMLKNLEYLVGVLLFVPSPNRILILGTAAGSLLHFLRHYYLETAITAVDIDAELVEKILEMEFLPPAQPGLSYVYDDAERFIRNCDEKYDLVLIDIFSGAQSPRWLLQKSAVEDLHKMLEPQGALAYNLLIASDHDFNRFYRNLRIVFEQQTLCLPVKDYENSIAYGIRNARPALDMEQNIQRASVLSERLGVDFLQILAVIYNTNPVGRGII